MLVKETGLRDGVAVNVVRKTDKWVRLYGLGVWDPERKQYMIPMNVKEQRKFGVSAFYSDEISCWCDDLDTAVYLALEIWEYVYMEW